LKTLYISQQGSYVSLRQEFLQVKLKDRLIAEVQLPLLEQVLIFGQAQITTQAIRACLWRNIPIVYLSRMGFCYGRTLSLEQGYRHLFRYQQELSFNDRLWVARSIVQAKLKNSRVLLQRQNRRSSSPRLTKVIQSLDYFSDQAMQSTRIEQLMGYEGTGASLYFSVFDELLLNSEFVFLGRSRRPPGNPVNALLSFGYQLLWNHILALIELQGLDPYQACLHQGSDRHAALASDLIEEFRAPIIDSLVLYLINRSMIKIDADFDYRNSGCFLNTSGRSKFLKAFIQRMEESFLFNNEEPRPRWDTLLQQVKRYKTFVYSPTEGYQPYLIR